MRYFRRLVYLTPLFFVVCFTQATAMSLPHAGTANWYDVQYCWNFTVVDPRAYPDKRTYTIEGICRLFKSGGAAADAKFRIYAEYNRVWSIAKESGYLWFDTLHQAGAHKYVGFKKLRLRTQYSTEVSYLCNEDPWLKGGVCKVLTQYAGPPTQIGDNPATNAPDQEILMLHLYQQDPPIPLSRGARAKIHAYLDATYLKSKRKPLIVSPKYNAAYKVGELIVDVDRDPPDVTDWQLTYVYPPEASTVQFEWQRWNPLIPGWVWVNPSNMLDSIDNIDTTANVVIPTTWNHEGLWQVRARHAVEGWESTGWKEFWIGDRLDYNRSNIFEVFSPLPGEEFLTTDSQRLYPIQFDVQHSADWAIEVHYDHYNENLEGEWGWGSAYSEQVYCCQNANQPWVRHLEEGLWAFRVRWKKMDDATLYYPWSEWIQFWAGPAHDVHQPFKLGSPMFTKAQEKN